MKSFNNQFTFLVAGTLLLTAILGCGGTTLNAPDWVKSKKIAGKEQKLSHISNLAVDGKFAFVVIGGTVADQNEGTNGLRKVDLETGAVTNLDNGEKMPQSETGGIAIDDKYVYWNAGGTIQRIAKDGGKSETVAGENVGIGIDMAVDNERVYWANHGYYSPNVPVVPRPLYSAPKNGGAVETFTEPQMIPGSITIDEKFVYWTTVTSIMKKAKSGGDPVVVFQAGEKEGVDKLTQDADSLYFRYRGPGESRWALRKIAKSGGEPVTLVRSFSLSPAAVDEKYVYFFDEDSINKNALCRIAKQGGEVERLDSGYSSGAISQSKTQVFFASLDDIYSFSK